VTAAPPPAHELAGLFDVVARLRAVNADALLALFFEPRGIPKRTAMRRLAELVRERFLAHVRLEGTRCIYHLTAKGLAASTSRERVTHWIRRPPAPRQADYCWLRSALVASLTREGWDVGRTWRHQLALRQHVVGGLKKLIDNRLRGNALMVARAHYENARTLQMFTPIWRAICATCGWRGDPGRAVDVCGRCGREPTPLYSKQFFRCTGCGYVADEVRSHGFRKKGGSCVATMRETDPLTFDVAFRGDEIIVVFIDNPSRPFEEQFGEIPFVHCEEGRIRLPFVARSADADSRFDLKSGKWATIGSRHRALLRELAGKGRFLYMPDRVTVIDYRPDIQLRFVR
jgi:hypothetical protein